MSWRLLTREEIAEPFVRLWNEDYPEAPKSEAQFLAESNYLPEGSLEENWALDSDGRCVAVLSAYDEHDENPVQILTVEPVVDHDAEAMILNAVFHKTEEILSRVRPKKAQFWTSTRHEGRIRRLEMEGYVCNQIVPFSILHLAEFDPAPFQAKLQSVASQGIEITTIGELDRRGIDWKENLYYASDEMAQDVPSPVPLTRPNLERYKELLDNPVIYYRDLMFCALDEGKIVGYSRLTPDQVRGDTIMTGLSGTVRSHRRRGIVTAVKVHGIMEAKRRGFKDVMTDNDDTNPMYQINLSLGFKPLVEHRWFEKSFDWN